jgi:hypothetical protein
MFCRSLCFFVLFLSAIVLSVLLRYTDSDYPFGIFKLFFNVLVGYLPDIGSPNINIPIIVMVKC